MGTYPFFFKPLLVVLGLVVFSNQAPAQDWAGDVSRDPGSPRISTIAPHVGLSVDLIGVGFDLPL